MTPPFATVEKPSRWNASFDPEMTDADVAKILALAPFNSMDANAFPRSLSLQNIIRHDTRLRRYRPGEIVVREGDYGHSAFMIMSGSVEVVLSPSLPPSLLGRRESKRKNIFRVVAQLWSNSKEPESFETAPGGRRTAEPSRVFLQDVPRVLEHSRTVILRDGEFFGEIAALSRMPRTATVLAKEPAELLEVRWQGLRDVMRYDSALRDHINRIYHDRALKQHLLSIPLFKKISERALERVMAQTQYGTYGQYEWSGEYKRLAGIDPGLRASKEPAIAQEGDYPDGIVLIRAGFARLSHRLGAGERTLNYLGAGQQYGLAEIVHNWRNPGLPVALRHTLRAVGYTHVLVIPTAIIEEVVLSTLSENEIRELLPPVQESSTDAAQAGAGDVSGRIGPDLFEFLTDNRFFNGTATMVIDLDRCTRCDDCVRACSAAHDNNPRFLRNGPSHDRVMIANACMHCVDPVCMIGCPTGAISRNPIGGQVVINPATCIGCKTCFNNCPYDAIRMVEARDRKGGILVDDEMKPVLKATKCDLCVDQLTGPACQRACPHGALVRMNMNNLTSFASWLRK